jgi:MFS family permease
MVSPNIFPVYLLRIIFALASMGPICSPLINDYVKNGSRGRAGALLIFGFQIGEFFNSMILLNLIKDLPLGTQFKIAGGVVLVVPILGLFLIKEPRHMIKNTGKSKRKQPSKKLSVYLGIVDE